MIIDTDYRRTSYLHAIISTHTVNYYDCRMVLYMYVPTSRLLKYVLQCKCTYSLYVNDVLA